MSIRNILVLLLLIAFVACQPQKPEKTLTLYCAAGMKPPIEKLAKMYTEKYGVNIEIQYGGSGTLLANMRIARQGDLYLAADRSYIDEAKAYGLLMETQPLAVIKPVISVQKGNPKNINALEDLLNSDVNYSLGNPDAASIGRLTRQVLNELELWDAVKEKATVFKPTVNEVLNDVHIGAVDACIAWDASTNQYESLEAVELASLNKHQKQITIGVLNYSNQSAEALKFIRFISSPEHGNRVFKELGYSPVKGDIWEEKPQILFFSGGVNRVAIESTIQEFEKREGVEVIRVYNGCGILVSQIKSGQHPDAYLSCDVSFMTQVEDQFIDISDVSGTDIVIAVAKENPKSISSLGHLANDGLKIGVCNPKQSALGALTKILLESKELWDPVYPNIYSQTPTADLLVNQLRTGSLDAAIVYRANLSQVTDKLDIVNINDEKAKALQNFGIESNSNKKWMTKRLFEALTNEKSKTMYLQNGFNWEYKLLGQ